MRRLFASVGALGVLAVLAVVAFQGDTDESDGVPAISRELNRSPSTGELPALPGPRAIPRDPGESEETASADSRVADDGPDKAPEPQDDRKLAEIRGVFLLPDDSPAPGVQLRVHGWQANTERVRAHGLPEGWENLQATTDEAGRFSIRFDPPQAFQFTLDGSLPGHAEASWRWHQILPAEVVDVGEVRLAAAGTIVGRVVDTEGKPAPGRWRVYADSSHEQQGRGGDRTRVSVAVDPVDGSFRLEGVPPGVAELKANSALASWIDGPSVQVEAGRSHEADITYDGPDLGQRIVLYPFTRPFYPFDPEAESVHLRGPGGDIIPSSRGMATVWDDLQNGVYTLEIDDPKFEGWSQSGVTPGERVDAHLVGSAAVALTVQDPAGEPVIDYDLTVRFREVRFSPNIFKIREAKDELPPGGVYTGIVPHTLTLVVEVEGWAPLEIDVDLRPGETREIVGSLSAGSTLRGVVLSGAEKEGVSDVEVTLEPWVEEEDQFQRSMAAREAARDRTRTTRTDAAGRFEIDRALAGTWRLSASQGPEVSTEIRLEIEGSADEEVELALPAAGWLVGRLVGAADADFDQLFVETRPLEAPTRTRRSFGASRSDGSSPIEADGRFRHGPLLPGEVQVLLVFPGSKQPLGSGSWTGVEGPRTEIARAMIEAGLETTCEIDVREKLPGRIRIRGTLDGKPAAALVVTAQQLGEDGTRSGNSMASQLDATGQTTLGPLPPGRWRLLIRPSDSLWVHRTEAIEVPAGAEASHELSLQLIPGSILVLDAETAAPLADVPVWIHTEGRSRSVRTDREGRIELSLPTSSFSLSPEGMTRDSAVTIDWTPAGPSPEVVRLKHRAEDDD